jgi:TM2 domain-containing membrane protein YozV
VSETLVEQALPKARPAAAPFVACVLAWLVPGLGHFYLGRKGRAAAFFVVVVAMFILGIGSGGAASLIEDRQPLTFLATFDNVAAGPIDLVGRYLTYGTIVYALPATEGDPKRTQLLDRLRVRVRSVTYEYGNTFLLTAGLMNLLLILDAFDIAKGRKD